MVLFTMCGNEEVSDCYTGHRCLDSWQMPAVLPTPGWIARVDISTVKGGTSSSVDIVGTSQNDVEIFKND